MSSGGTAAVQFPIRFADIIFAEVLDSTSQNPKTRRADYVKLPYKNPPGRHPKTGLTKEAAVLCTWVVSITPNDIRGRSGFVPPAHMAIVNSKTAARAKVIGGWP